MIKKHMLQIAVAGIFSGCLVGCGGGNDDGGSGPPAKKGTVSKPGAQTVVTNVAQMKTAVDTGNGATLAFNLEFLALTGPQQMVQPVAALSLIRSALTSVGTAGGTATCTSTGCTYSNYSNGQVIINGKITSTVAADGTVVVADLTMKEASAIWAAAGITSLTYNITGSLTFTGNSVDGDLKSVAHATGSYSGYSFSEDLYNELKFTLLTWSASTNAPISGSIYAKWATTVSGAPASSQAFEATITYP